VLVAACPGFFGSLLAVSAPDDVSNPNAPQPPANQTSPAFFHLPPTRRTNPSPCVHTKKTATRSHRHLSQTLCILLLLSFLHQ